MDAQPYFDRLADEIIAQNPNTGNPPIAELSLFPAPYSGNLYYVCGDLGLSTAYITWAEHFASFQHYAMWLWIDPETKRPAAHIRFASADDAKAFYTANGSHLHIRDIEGTVVVIE